MDDEGRTTEPDYTLKFTYEPKGSGELIILFNRGQIFVSMNNFGIKHTSSFICFGQPLCVQTFGSRLKSLAFFR